MLKPAPIEPLPAHPDPGAPHWHCSACWGTSYVAHGDLKLCTNLYCSGVPMQPMVLCIPEICGSSGVVFPNVLSDVFPVNVVSDAVPVVGRFPPYMSAAPLATASKFGIERLKAINEGREQV